MLRSSKPVIRALLVVFCGIAVIILGTAWVQSGCPTWNGTGTQPTLCQDWTYQSAPMGEDYIICENTSDTAGEGAAIQAAGATWNADRARFNFTYGGNGCSAAPTNDGVNQIRWGTTSGSLATTTWWYNTTTGDISEADCVFNDEYNWSTATPTPATDYDVESVMLHEFGHYLSLNHSTAPAIMQPTIGSGQQRRTLTTDDQGGIRAIYGTSCSALGASAQVEKQGSTQTLINLGLLLAPIMLVLAVRLFASREPS